MKGFRRSRPTGFSKGRPPSAGPKPWSSSVGVPGNVLRKPIRKTRRGFKKP